MCKSGNKRMSNLEISGWKFLHIENIKRLCDYLRNRFEHKRNSRTFISPRGEPMEELM